MPYRKTESELGRLRRRRAQILDAACATVQAAGFAGAQARVIAAAAGVSVGSLYSNFDGIDGVHCEVFRVLVDRELARVALDITTAAGPGPALAAIVRGFGVRSLSAPMVAWALLLEPVGRAIEQLRLEYRGAYTDLAAGVIADGIAAGEFVPQAVEVAAPAVIGALSESLVRPLDPALRRGPAGSATPHAQLIEDIVALCLRAVGADPRSTGGYQRSTGGYQR